MNVESKFYLKTAKLFEAKKPWWKQYIGKRFLNLNEPQDGEFDILQVSYIPTTSHSNCKEDIYEVICFSKRLYVATCSALYFPSLKYIGAAKHKVVEA